MINFRFFIAFLQKFRELLTLLDLLLVYSHSMKLDRWLYQLEPHLEFSIFQQVVHAPV